MPRTKLSPRKAPTQERSRATVDALVQATADILVREVLANRKFDSLEELVRTLVALGFAAHAVDPKLHHALAEELPARRARKWEPEDAPMLEALGRFRTDVPDPELALWLIDTVSHAVIHRAVVERPEALSQGLLQEELVTLLLRYLKRK
jgi:hypothetical protein